MKIFQLRIGLAAIILSLLAIGSLEAQSFKTMSFNGSTGLYSIPSGRIGWEQEADFGLDIGYHMIHRNGTSHIPAAAVSLFRWVEVSGAFDIKPDNDAADFLLGAKFQLPVTKTAIALGGNFQNLRQGNYVRSAGQVYIATTYNGQFFNMPAETSVVLGKTFIEGSSDSNIDFGMGFDFLLFPDFLQNFVHLTIDFANFSYSANPYSVWSRGFLDVGLRIDLSAIKALSKYKVNLDLALTNAFDTNRAFALGLVLGMPIKL